MISFQETFEVQLNNYEIELELNWTRDFLMPDFEEETRFDIINSKCCVAQLLSQLKTTQNCCSN